MRYVRPSTIPRRMALAALFCASACLSGCWTRVVLIPPGEPVRLREPVQAKVWIADASGQEIPAVVELPAGWYCLPDPGAPPPPEPAP